MKILKTSLTILAFLALSWTVSVAWAGNITISPDQAPEGIRVWVKHPPKVDENPDLELWVRPKEKKLVLQNSGEFTKAYFKLFSEGPNKIRIEALEEVKGSLTETELVKILTPTVEIQKNEGTAKLIVVLSDEASRGKHHFVVRFFCKEKMLAKADIWLEIPSRFKQFTRIESSQDLEDHADGITFAHGIRDSKNGWQLTFSYGHRFSSDLEGSRRVSASFRKDW